MGKKNESGLYPGIKRSASVSVSIPITLLELARRDRIKLSLFVQNALAEKYGVTPDNIMEIEKQLHAE